MSQSCLITGCTLYVPAEAKALHGDLHVFNDQYVFNGTCNRLGSPQWLYLPDTMTSEDVETASTRTVTLLPGADFFEKRGVLVFPQVAGALNRAAQDYVTTGSRLFQHSPHFPLA